MQKKKASFASFLHKLRKRRIIETLAAFIGGGWLLVEVVERLLVSHYHLPDRLIDLTVVSVIGALLATLVWRWFRSAEMRPGNVKVEILLVPLIILATVAVDLALVLKIAGITDKTLLTGIIALCLGIGWVILKLSQWASAMPESGKGEAKVSSPATVRPEKSIVVLPFTDLSPQKDQDYFCDGMTEEIITDLSHVHELLVISRSSAMTFKGSSKTVRDIAKDLNIRYALEGSVRKAGNGLRITAQLIDAMNDTHIWAEKYAGELDDVFDMQERVSRSVVEALRIKLSLGEAARISERPIDNVQAYDYYLRAKRMIFTSCTADGLNQALHDLKAGLAIMGDNVILNQGMAEVYLHHYEYGIRADEETLKRAEEYTNKVIGRNPDSAEGYYLLGRIERFRGTVIKAIAYFKRALAVDPNHNNALFFMANGLGLHAGKASLAEPFLKRLQEIDPLTTLLIFLIGYIQWLDGKIDDAISTFQFLTTLTPEVAWGRFMTAHIFAGQGKNAQVFKLADDLAQNCPDDQVTSWTVALKFALQGEKKKALTAFSEKAREFFWHDPEVPWFGASLFAILDEKSEALDWLEHAVDRGWINYPLFAERNPLFASIRGEERFKKLMERVKYEWEHFEV